MSLVKPREKVKEVADELVKVLHEEYGWFGEEELKNTGTRIAKFFEEFYQKAKANQDEEIKVFETNYNGFVIDVGIEVKAMCSHHLLPIVGEMSIAYIPKNGKYLGLSKLSRIAKRYLYQPILQEEVTRKILDEIVKEINPEFAMVVITARHYCKVFRGTEDKNSIMMTVEVYPKSREAFELEKKAWSYIKFANMMKKQIGGGL